MDSSVEFMILVIHLVSVNENIPKDLCTVQYDTLDKIIQFVIYYGQGSYISKSDIEKAFRIIPLHQDSFHLMGFKWKDQYFYDKCLPMGCSISCKLFEEFSTSIQWILSHVYHISGISHILDDFMFVDSSFEACNKKLEIFLSVTRWLNIPIKSSKTFRPCQIMIVHGIEVDTIAMEMRLPKDKLDKAQEQLQRLRHSKKTTFRILQSIIGLLNFACQVVVPGRAFFTTINSFNKGSDSSFPPCPSQQRSDFGH